LGLGDIEGGIAAIQSAAGILRSAEISPAHRNLAALYLANGGCDLWRNTRNTLAIDLVREGIAKLESGGAAFAAFPYRIALAGFLRQLGEFDGAWEALPQEPSASHLLRHTFLAERAELRLAVGDVELAVADCRELVALWRAHPCTPAPEIASAEALLAEACLAAGDMAEADALAVRAADVLGPWQHPYTASCLVTLALARSESAGGFASAGIGEAIRLLDAAPLLTAAEKARLKAAQLGRIPQATAPAFS
jgi:tetratricopeptide (TPR) repeat protein